MADNNIMMESRAELLADYITDKIEKGFVTSEKANREGTERKLVYWDENLEQKVIATSEHIKKLLQDDEKVKELIKSLS